jgi:predicted ATPase/DNA-binding CsgD family transcriptional regulator
MTDMPQPTSKGTAHDPGPTFGSAGKPERTPLGNLPLELSSLVGRSREVSEVGRLLADSRLLTLIGPGGSGKTRLALAVAKDVAHDFEDGAWLVELAPLSDPDLVPQAVASVLGVRETPGAALVDSLRVRLASGDTLLVLDNCEHLVGACADLAGKLLGSCPRLRVLATSREALGVLGESLYPVPPLALPDPRHLRSARDLDRYEAAGLFVERARAVRPGFGITERNAAAVARICFRLDGMPLAIELAAARARILSVEQISERLEGSFALLSGGGRTAMPHHKTLRATMDWSHDLLSEEERVLFGRLSLFAGGWTLEAAEAVCAGEGIEEAGVLDPLSGLVDKSLVLVSERDGQVRYRLLETVRQFGREKLEESGEAARVHRSHAGFFVGLAEEAAPELKGHAQVAWLERLEREHDNLRAAMRWLLEEGEVETAARLAWALRLFWYVRGHQREGYRYIAQVLRREGVLSKGVRARASCAAGLMSYGLEGHERTQRLWEESAALFRQIEDGPGLAVSLAGVGLTTLQQGDAERADAHFEEALRLYREGGDRWGASSVLSHLGIVRLRQGDHAAAVRYFEEALEIAREIGDRLIGSIALYNLALQESRQSGDHELAAELYAEALGLAVEMGDRANAAYCLEGLAGLISARDEPSRATRLLGASEALLEAVGTPRYVQAQADVLHERAVESLRSRLGEEAFAEAWAEGHRMTPEQAVDHALLARETPPQAGAPAAYPANLSAREVEVLRLAASGLTNARIAEELYISPRTVNAHLGSVYNKIGSSTRAEAARFASENGLL